MKKLLIILLSCFCLFAFSGITMAQEQPVKLSQELENLFPGAMTYDGVFNPKDAVDETKYKPVTIAKTSDPRMIIVFSQAIQDLKIKYVAIVYFNTPSGVKIVSLVYLDEYNKFHQIGLLQLFATHYTEKQIDQKNLNNFRIDFNKFFGLSLQKNKEYKNEL